MIHMNCRLCVPWMNWHSPIQRKLKSTWVELTTLFLEGPSCWHSSGNQYRIVRGKFEVLLTTRKHSWQYGRYRRCIAVDMSPIWIFSDEEQERRSHGKDTGKGHKAEKCDNYITQDIGKGDNQTVTKDVKFICRHGKGTSSSNTHRFFSKFCINEVADRNPIIVRNDVLACRILGGFCSMNYSV